MVKSSTVDINRGQGFYFCRPQQLLLGAIYTKLVSINLTSSGSAASVA